MKELCSDSHALMLRTGAQYDSACGYMYSVIRKLKPLNIIETGVQNGFSTEIFLRAMRANGIGRLYSIDSGSTSTDGSHATDSNQTLDGIPGQFINPGLLDRWNLTIGLSSEFLEDILMKVRGLKIIFHHDSDHGAGNVRFETKLFIKYARVGSIFAMHDWSGQFDINEEPFNRLEPLDTQSQLRLWRLKPKIKKNTAL